MSSNSYADIDATEATEMTISRCHPCLECYLGILSVFVGMVKIAKQTFAGRIRTMGPCTGQAHKYQGVTSTLCSPCQSPADGLGWSLPSPSPIAISLAPHSFGRGVALWQSIQVRLHLASRHDHADVQATESLNPSPTWPLRSLIPIHPLRSLCIVHLLSTALHPDQRPLASCNLCPPTDQDGRERPLLPLTLVLARPRRPPRLPLPLPLPQWLSYPASRRSRYRPSRRG